MSKKSDSWSWWAAIFVPFFLLIWLLWIVGKVLEIVGKVLVFVNPGLKWPYEAMDRLFDHDFPSPAPARTDSPPLSPPPKRIGDGDGGGPDADGAKRPASDV